MVRVFARPDLLLPPSAHVDLGLKKPLPGRVNADDRWGDVCRQDDPGLSVCLPLHQSSAHCRRTSIDLC